MISRRATAARSSVSSGRSSIRCCLLLIYTVRVHEGDAEDHPPEMEPYALFMFCGILPWTWFSSSLLESSNTLIAGGNLIKKVLFPAEVLPIVTVLANMVHFFLGLPILGRRS